MKHATFIAQMGELLAGFPEKVMPDQTVELWWKYFECLPDKVFVDGVQKAILTHEYPTLPTIGEVAKACVGTHFTVIPPRRRGRGEASVDEIMKAYQERFEARRLAPDPRPAEIVAPAPVLQLPGPRWEDFEVEIAQLRARVATLERENGELSKLLADRDKNLTVMGAELARLEREWRGRRHG